MNVGEPQTTLVQRPSDEANRGAVARLKVLSLTTAYPNAREPGSGVFIRSRLRAMAAYADIRVLAPVSPLQFTDWHNIWRGVREIPFVEDDGNIRVLHPRWVYPPLVGGLNGLWLYLQLARPLSAFCTDFRFDVIDAHFGFPEAVTAALLAQRFAVPFTITLRGIEMVHAQYLLRRRQMRWALRRASRVIAVSERLRQFAIALGISPHRVVTIPNGVDNTVFFRRDRTECRNKHGIRPAEPIILSAGHLIELKGHHHIVNSLKMIAQNGMRVRLLIAGGTGRASSYEQAIRQEVATLGLGDSVSFLGHVPPQTLAELMSVADVLCLASSREGWPNVVHEAMSCGTPVVATDVGAVPDMIPSEDYGFIVPVNDESAMSAALQRALAKQWDHAKIAARAQKRSWSQVAQDVIEVLDGIVVQRPLA